MDIITRHKWFFLILSLLIALPFVIRLREIKTIDNVDYFTLENDPDANFYKEFKNIFGNDEFFIIAFNKKNLFTYQNLTLLKEITTDIEEIEGVREVKSLANVNDTIGENDFFIVQKFLEEIPEEKKDLEKLKTNALANPLYVNNFISLDGKTAAIVVSVYERPNDPGYRKRLVQNCEKVLHKYLDQTGEVFMAGWTTTNLYLSQFMKRDISVFIPVTYLFITISVFLFFRNILLTCIALLNISLCMGSTMGLFPILDITLNNVTTIVPPVVMALALCDTVHIYSHLDQGTLAQFKKKEDALCHVLKKVIVPSFLTTLTTAVGFFSLYSSKLVPIKEFALIASAGMVFEFIYAFLFLPSLILFFPERKIFTIKSEQGAFNIFLDHIFRIINSRYFMICFLSIGVVIATGFAAFKIKVDTNVLNYFKKDSEVRISTDFIETQISGVRTIEIDLVSAREQEEPFKDPVYLTFIEKLQQEMEAIEGVDKTISFVDFLKDMNQSFHNENPLMRKLPESKPLVAQYLLLYGSDDIYDFVNESFDRARISLRINRHGTADQKRILEQLTEVIKAQPNQGLAVRITGKVVQDINMIEYLVNGQISSLSIAAGVIAIMMFFVMKSFKLGLVSIVPNFFPIILNFGIMGVAGVPLNAATSLIAAIALGIAVDDTIHFLTAFKKNVKKNIPISKAINMVILEKGRALFSSSLILVIGFIIMVLSFFVPTIYFGLLSSIIMVSALIGDVFILPALLLALEQWKILGDKYA
ncbi:efflux RND transporter permease subunit [Desulfospira joergensenii]|uniref:efflux RND transporter permease subunit n=1 Tax=Desulfospira joergensenii TaxID=53329 RepID=UPI0003B37989|nr:MMPL family transporter [Desulfospira joergensenii]